jgi:hypothetical protein
MEPKYVVIDKTKLDAWFAENQDYVSVGLSEVAEKLANLIAETPQVGDKLHAMTYGYDRYVIGPKRVTQVQIGPSGEDCHLLLVGPLGSWQTVPLGSELLSRDLDTLQAERDKRNGEEHGTN